MRLLLVRHQSEAFGWIRIDGKLVRVLRTISGYRQLSPEQKALARSISLKS
jgi:hypothetical protein